MAELQDAAEALALKEAQQEAEMAATRRAQKEAEVPKHGENGVKNGWKTTGRVMVSEKYQP